MTVLKTTFCIVYDFKAIIFLHYRYYDLSLSNINKKIEMVVIKNKDLIQSYIMTTAKYDYSVDEKRILLKLINTWQYLLDGEKLEGKITKTLFGNYEFEFPISYFIKDGQTNYNRVKEALRSLNEKKFEYEDDGNWAIIRIIEIPYIENRQHIKFTLNARIISCFTDFTKGYRKFELETSLNFKSVYSMRFYELFSGQKSPIIYTIDSLKAMFSLSEKYSRSFDFIKKVIKSAKKELDLQSPYSFEFQPVKQGKKITAIKFYPIELPHNRDIELEQRALQKQVALSWDFDKIEKQYFSDLGFSTTEIKNNIDLFKLAKKELDLIYELSILKAKSRAAKNPKGYIISALRGKLTDRGINLNGANTAVSPKIEKNGTKLLQEQQSIGSLMESIFNQNK